MQHGDRVAGLMDHLAALDPDGPDSQSTASGRHREALEGHPRLLTLPVSLRSALVRVRPSAVWGAAVLVVLVLAVVGVRSAWAQRAAEPTPVSAADGDPFSRTSAPQDGEVVSEDPSVGTTGGDPAPPGVPDPAAEPQTVAPMYVHVVGAVGEPGVVEVPSGARVSDVVDSAGGLSSDADPSRINLARVVVDGERIWVPVAGEEPPEEVAASRAPDGSNPSGGGRSDPGTGADGGATSDVVDVNTADSAVLQTLPGVGPVTAESILAWRTEHGRFATVEELMEVRGIGPRTLDQLKPLVVVGP